MVDSLELPGSMSADLPLFGDASITRSSAIVLDLLLDVG